MLEWANNWKESWRGEQHIFPQNGGCLVLIGILIDVEEEVGERANEFFFFFSRSATCQHEKN